MSKKKDKSLLREVENEINRLTVEHEAEVHNEDSPPDLKVLLGEMLKQQQQQHADLLRSISESSQAGCRSMVSAIKEVMKPVTPIAPPPPEPRLDTETPPPSLFEAEDESSVEDFDFDGWDIP